jgi:hypothetical protein
MRRARDDRTELAADDSLCAVLRGEDAAVSAAVVDAARRHRIHLVLAHRAGDRVHDAEVHAALSTDLREAAAGDLFRERELRRVVDHLAAANVRALLLKGAGLAYTVYETPHLRPRGDVDVLIAHGDLEPADRALAASGWLRAVEQDSERVTRQRHYLLRHAGLLVEQLDVHWKIAVPHLFGDALRFDELAARAVPIGALGPHAWTLSPPDALFLACLHRVAHHHDAIDLLWLWDIHLLASRLSDAERGVFAELAASRSMRAICARGLSLAGACFATPGASELIAATHPDAGDANEPSAGFLGGGLRQIDLLRSDFSTLGGWRARLSLLGGHLFPNPRYVRSLYPRWPAVALPLAYLDRIVRGAPKWFRRPSA